MTPTPIPSAVSRVGELKPFDTLREANVARQRDWCPDQLPDLSFRGNELAGETGEVCNVIKKLERERLGWRGSRDTLEHLAEELGDVVICADLIAISAGIDLDAAVEAKFNATSEKVGLPHRLSRRPLDTAGGVEPVALIDQAMDCDAWYPWLSDIVELTNQAADAADMSTEQAVAYGILQALASRTPNTEVVVKALEWVGDDAVTPFGTYRVERTDDGYALTFEHEELVHIGFNAVEPFQSPRNEAMSRAQPDFDQRIRSALASPPSPAQASPFDERDATNLLSVIADIREKSGVGAKPMLSELADAIAARIASPAQTVTDALRHAFRNADESDWSHLFAVLPDTGRGKFWQAVMAEARTALQPSKGA